MLTLVQPYFITDSCIYVWLCFWTCAYVCIVLSVYVFSKVNCVSFYQRVTNKSAKSNIMRVENRGIKTHGGLCQVKIRAEVGAVVEQWRKGSGPDSGPELYQENVPERETSAAARLPPGAETAGFAAETASSLCLTDVAVSVGNGRDSAFCLLYFLRSDW